jgi:hypothetical protein
MSDSLPERLSKFTPSAGRLDRDALLFAAGRSSARANRLWQGLSVVLATGQLLTLACFWPRAATLGTGAADLIVRQSAPADPVDRQLPTGSNEPHIWSARREPDELLREHHAAERIVLADREPELRAFGPLPDSMLN